jgi:hypothetical protein
MDPEDPEQRMVEVTRWYVSGWHVKPKGVKKPYNPVLGEIFRCNYELPDGSLMTCCAEQVSHHPPISALYCENQKKGLIIEGWYYPRSKFLGNSAASYVAQHIQLTKIGWQTAWLKSHSKSVTKSTVAPGQTFMHVVSFLVD